MAHSEALSTSPVTTLRALKREVASVTAIAAVDVLGGAAAIVLALVALTSGAWAPAWSILAAGAAMVLGSGALAVLVKRPRAEAPEGYAGALIPVIAAGAVASCLAVASVLGAHSELMDGLATIALGVGLSWLLLSVAPSSNDSAAMSLRGVGGIVHPRAASSAVAVGGLSMFAVIALGVVALLDRGPSVALVAAAGIVAGAALLLAGGTLGLEEIAGARARR